MQVRALVCLSAAVITCVFASSARAASGDGGSGTYTATGASFDFNLDNVGTTNWLDFTLIGPPGSVFLGAATQGEITVPCAGNPPGGSVNELQCGPVSAAGLAPGTHILVAATMSSGSACGQPFQLEVSSTGTPPFSSVGAVSAVAACTPSAPVTTCTDAGAVETAASETDSSLDALAHSLAGPWPQALVSLAGAGTALRSLRASASLPSDSYAIRSLTSAETVVTAATTAAHQAEQLSGATTAALAQAQSLQATDASLPTGCEGGAAPPASGSGTSAACRDAQAGLTLATTGGRLLASTRLRLGSNTLVSAPDQLRAAALSLLEVSSGGSGAGLKDETRTAAQTLRRAAELLSTGLADFAGVRASLQTATALRAAAAAVATCSGG